jgi:VWFA-related protein
MKGACIVLRVIPSRVTVAALTSLLLCGQDSTFSTGVKVVNVFATVRDKQGHIVTSLNKEDFTLSEDGRQQAIRYFSRESGLPLTLGLLVDTSGSQRGVLGEERKASYSFMSQVLREDKDQAFVVHFEGEAELLQDLTSSRKKLEAALEQLEVPPDNRPQWGGRGGPGGGGGRGAGRRGPGGGTALYDAVLLASDELMKKQQGRKAFIVLSDGVDNASKVSLASAIESAQRADTLVYCILFSDKDAYGGGRGGLVVRGPGWGGGRGGMGGGRGGGRPRTQESHVDGKKVLQQLAKETGGGYFEVSSKQPLEQIYKRIDEELRNQYSLGYTPDRADAPGAFRKILVATSQKNLVVQARDGYYADH